MTTTARIQAGQIRDAMNEAHDLLLTVIADPIERKAQAFIDALSRLEQDAKVARQAARDGLPAPSELGGAGQPAGKDLARLAAAARRDALTLTATGLTTSAKHWKILLRNNMGAGTPWSALVGRLG
jgi:hypothetical protein